MKSFTFAKFISTIAAASILALSPLTVFAEDITPPADTTATEQSTATSVETTTAPPVDTSTTSSDISAPTIATTEPTTQTATPEPVVTPEADTTGPTQPNGASGTTYTYNATTGKWENDYYIWDPVTKQTSPKTPQSYSYNPETGRWDTTEWVYDAAANKYVENTSSVSLPPENSLIAPASLAENTLAPATPADNSSTGIFDLFFNGSISNVLNSQATSGDALINRNTNAGSALTGDALAIATIINLIQSNANLLGGTMTTFRSDIQGDVVGDLLINPSKLAELQTANATSPSTLTVNTDMNGQINNDITVSATSGDATISSNTNAGNAQTGNADALVNLVNFINSTVAAGSSFLGMINIYGNLDGDILLPPDLLNILFASNAPVVATQQDTQLSVNNTNNQAIHNDVTTTAASGTATLANNTSAGSAISGNGSTNITLLNLTGSQTIGKNALLVFVNVLGNWVGLIMNAPTGTTAAGIGGGITSNTTQPMDTTINTTTDSQINNTVRVAAQTGDATATGNTTVGDARTGNATASANILNIIGSQLSFSDWFGVLFINVFGSWRGSFGVNTEAGNAPVHPTVTTPTPSGPAATTPQAQVFGFKPKTAASANQTYGSTQEEPAPTQQQAAVAGASSATPPSGTAQTASATVAPRGFNFMLPALGVFLAIILLGAERFITLRQRMPI